MAYLSIHQRFHLGEEKHQMLNLNQRLETYLSRVKLLEDENILLTKEIQALRGSSQNEATQRKGLEKKVQQARLEVDSAWRERAHTALEVGRLMEELRDLDMQRQREAQAQVKANKMLERSRKEMEEEQRAQIWLRETVAQLEQEMKHLIQMHQEDVARLEATLNQSRATMPPTLAHRANQRANVLQLGQEYSQQATRAWQEAARAYQGQLAHLEESVNQARSRLMQVSQEKSESQLKLQVLEKEIATAQDIKMHLEKTVAQQGQHYSQQIQEVQEHLLGLEAEKAELGQQINHLQLEKRDLLHAKTSLSLEVATYRALLDSQGFRGGAALFSLPANISITEAAFSPGGVKAAQSQLPGGHKTTSCSSVHTNTRVASVGSRKPASVPEAPKIPVKAPERTEVSAQGHQKVAVAELLLLPQHQVEAAADRGGEHAEDEAWEETAEQVVGSQVLSWLSTEPPLTHEEGQPDLARPGLTPYQVRIQEESCQGLEDPAPPEEPAAQEEAQEPHEPDEERVENQGGGEEHVQEESSDSETRAVTEATFESSPVSEDEPEESVFMGEQPCAGGPGRQQRDGEDKLYPDGEEMDTYASAMERRAGQKTGGATNEEEETRQHAEPEDDISARDQRPEESERRGLNTSVSPLAEGAPALQPHANEEDDEESWRTELESDSYAQDNTLADPRPLIRYEADGAAQASRVDQNEPSKGEQEEPGRWSEDQAHRFGTMEDLCEEAEGETLDEEYDLGYRHGNDRSLGQEAEQDLPLDGAQEVIRGVGERPSDDKPEEHISPAAEVETEGWVEEERGEEGSCFSQQQVSQTENPDHLHHSNPAEEAEEEEEEEQPSNSRCFSEPTVPDAEVQPEEQEPSEEREEQEEYVSMVMPADETESPSISRPDPEEAWEPGSHPRAAEANLEGVGVASEPKEQTPAESHRGPNENVAASQDLPQTADWGNLGEESRDENQDSESAESPVEDAAAEQQQQHLNMRPDPVEDHVFVVQTSADLVKTKGTDSSLHDFFSGVKSDYWVSSLETGATNQPEDERAEPAAQKLAFADASLWGDLAIDPPAGQKKQETSEAKQLRVHSEESEAEAESWSSGEEPV